MTDQEARLAPRKCDAEFAGYDGWFGIGCSLPEGHDGPHLDDPIKWWFVVDESKFAPTVSALPGLPDEGVEG